MNTHNPTYTRRQVLKFSLCGLLVAAMGLLLPSQRPTSAAAPKYTGLSTPSESMRLFGIEYLQQYPQENSRHALLDLLEANNSQDSDGPFGFSRELLRNSIRKDFSEDNVVYLKNWALSRTEARLFALSIV
jgi:hypothetical protein